MDKIWDRQSFEVRSLAVVAGMKKRMTTQNRQKSKKEKKAKHVVATACTYNTSLVQRSQTIKLSSCPETISIHLSVCTFPMNLAYIFRHSSSTQHKHRGNIIQRAGER